MENKDRHYNAMQRFDRITEVMQDIRKECRDDRRFYSIRGAQWENDIGRQFSEKPKLEVNQVHLSVIRILNDFLSNRITVNFIAKDGGDDKLTEVANGLYRADEQECNADEAHDNAFEEAVSGGFGAFRLCAEEEDEYDDDNEYQRIRILPIFDADKSVFFDLDAKRQDKRDATHCFVLSSMTRTKFEEEYPGAISSSVDSGIETVYDWFADDTITTAEYYVCEKEKITHLEYLKINGDRVLYSEKDFERNPDALKELQDTGARLIGEKKKTVRRVRKYIISGAEILEDCGYIAGREIPIVPVYGKRWFIDNIERCAGHVRYTRDPQQIDNMLISKLAENASFSPIEKPILTPEQVAGHETQWAQDNIKDYPYMLINPIDDGKGNIAPTGPVGYTKPPMIQPAVAKLLEVVDAKFRAVLGNQESGEEINGSTSGYAIELVQNRLDMQSFIYVSNMAKALKRSGEIWLSMARELYVEPKRRMKTIDDKDKSDSVILAQPKTTESGEMYYANDMTKANFDVVAEAGPSSVSKRQSVIRSLMAIASVTKDPETLQVLSSVMVMNMEGEGIDDVRDFYRKKLLRLGVAKPTDEEAAELAREAANQKPDANEEILMATAQKEKAQAMKLQSDAQMNGLKARETQANIAETVAKTAATYAGIEQKNREISIQRAQNLTKQGE